MEEGLFGITGYFGSGKTTIVSKIIMETLWNSKNVIIFGNVKMTKDYENYIFFEDMYLNSGKYKYTLLDILKLIDTNTRQEKEKNFITRSNRTRYLIILDEAGAIFSNQEWEKMPHEFRQYIVQIRKYNATMILIAQKYENITKSLREHIMYNLKYEPLLGRLIDKVLKFGRIIAYESDIDGNIKMEKYAGKDKQGDWILKEKPIQWVFGWIYKRKWWKYYDDLYLNKKYIEQIIDLDHEKYLKIYTNKLKEKELKFKKQKKI